MIKKATRQHTKNHNLQLVLRTIYRTKSTSRADIARATHLTRPTVSTLVSELIAEGLVRESGLGDSAGGKRPRLLEIDADARQVLAIDIGNQEFRGALCNLRGELVERVTAAAVNGRGDSAVSLIYELIERLLPAASAPLLGIGIGTPGLIDPKRGIVRQAVNLDWHDLPLRQLLAVRYDLPIYVTNDSQAAALAEYTFGDPHPSRHLLLLKTGQGIGAGLVLNGEPFYGDGFGAGEIGQVVVAESESGQLETLEAVAGTRALLQQAQQLRGPDLTWEALVTAVAAGDPELTAIVTEAATYLGISLANLIAALNLHHIVLAGRITQFGELLQQTLRESAYRHALPAMVAETTIRPSAFGADIVLLGCTALILKHELGIV